MMGADLAGKVERRLELNHIILTLPSERWVIDAWITNNGQTMRSLVLEAEKHLQACDRKLEDCDMILDSLEGLLETTPKPSELLGW